MPEKTVGKHTILRMMARTGSGSMMQKQRIRNILWKSSLWKM